MGIITTYTEMKISVFKYWLKPKWSQNWFKWIFSATFESNTLRQMVMNWADLSIWSHWYVSSLNKLVQIIRFFTMKETAPWSPQIPSYRLVTKTPPPSHSPAPILHPLPHAPGRGRKKYVWVNPVRTVTRVKQKHLHHITCFKMFAVSDLIA